MLQVRVSIVVPSYDRSTELCDIIEQLLQQDFEPFELIIVDQTSYHDAKTRHYLESVSGRVRYFQLSPPNVAAARNFGIRHSTGDIIVFFDDDMLVPSDIITRLVKSYAIPGVWGVTGFVLAPEEPEEHKYQTYRKLIGKNQVQSNQALIRTDSFLGGFMSFRKELFSRVGLFDEWMGTQPLGANEDLEFSRRASVRGYKLYLDTDLTVRHLASKQGGHRRSSIPVEAAYYDQMRLSLYSYLKNRRYKGLLGWIDAFWLGYHSQIFNRKLLRTNLTAILERHRIFTRALTAAVPVARHSRDKYE